jgi:hypothetical protein
MLPVEVRYLNVVWNDSETVLRLESSQNALEIEETPYGWQVETTTFPDAYHHIGFRIKEVPEQHIPYFELSSGGRQELVPLKVPGSDDVWWIQNGGWCNKRKRFLSELYRTAGRVDLVIQNQKLTIENNTFNFSVSELEYYLADFKNNLWMLILDNDSVAKGGIERETPDCFNDDVVDYFYSFAQSVEKIIRNPSMVLAECQRKLPLRSVRPVPRTFREYVIQPNAKVLTSRDYLESYDTAENRYIHYAVKRVLYILKSLSRLANAQLRSFGQKIEQENEWRAQLHKTDTKQVDSRVYDNEIAKLEGDLKALDQSLSGLISACFLDSYPRGRVEHGTYSFRFGDVYGKSSKAFFVNQLNGEDFRNRYETYLVAILPDNANFAMDFGSLRRCDLVITGRYIKSKRFNQNGNMYFEIKFEEITHVTFENHALQVELERLIEQRKNLERDDWVAPLTREERRDRDIERAVSEKKIIFYQNQLKSISRFSSSLSPIQVRLVQVASFLKNYNVKERPEFPSSMAFIQNPAYASAKSNFRKISNINGLNEGTLNSLMVVDDIGLVNIANLYEKWCLLQIIKVLNQIYGFELESGWQENLIGAALGKNENIDITLSARSRQQHLVLSYEKVLNSGKRPDFVIDLVAVAHERDQHAPHSWHFSGQKRSRLVLDAKFRGEMSEEKLEKLISSMYEGKDYSEGGVNQVFVIHPSPNVIDNRTSPLVWGSLCDYGQSHRAGHKYGAIFVSPSLTYSRSIDHLQRLIGLFLQSSSEILRTEKDTADWHNMCCISCGSFNGDSLFMTYSPTLAGSDRWIIKCSSCGLLTVKTICSSCREPLFKNGPKWTYHRTRAEQISNVVCPKCETFL